MEGMGITARLIFIFVIVFLAVPALGEAQVKRFIPKIYDIGGDIEVNASREEDENTTNGEGTKTTETLLRERLVLAANGYVYHPRFIQFLMKIAAGFKHEKFESAAAESPWSTGDSRDYEFRAIILPEHPYNLELFTRRVEPLVTQGLSRIAPAVSFVKGATFRYKRKPYFVTASYVDTLSESAQASFTTTSYLFNGAYFKQYAGDKLLSQTVSYRHTESESSVSGTGSSSDEAALSNIIGIKRYSLTSALSYTSSRQKTSDAPSSSFGFSWSEGLRASLPWNFGAGLNFVLSKSESETASAEKISSTSKTASFDLSHRLYESLVSGFGLSYSTQESPGGKSNTYSQSLAFGYTKRLRWGTLSAGANASRNFTDRTGTITTIDEQHRGVSVPTVAGSFLLNNQDVDEATIVVSLITCEPFESKTLTRGVHYNITPFGNTIQIDVPDANVLLPLFPPECTIPDTFDFRVTYALTRRDVELETDSLGYRLSLNLFDGLIGANYSHSESKQKVLSGDIDGEPSDSTVDTFGLSLSRRPFSALVEYTNVQSNIVPYKSWKAEAGYSQNITPTVSVRAKARYTTTQYPRGTSSGGTPFTDKVYGFDAGVQKRFPKYNMSISASGFYSQKTGLFESKSYGANAGFNWKIGKLLLDMGARLALADSKSTIATTKRINQFYFLNVKRKLF